MIYLKGVCLDYPIESDDDASLKKAIINVFSRKPKKEIKSFRALSDLSFIINSGESVGLIGLNGAGKSSLLRILSGIYTPTLGEIIVEGVVSPLLDFATGLELHHTGLENIKIRLMFLGLNEDEIAEKTPEIIEFSELGDFIHMPARTYSAGMFMRLAFAISTAINPEILVADEVVGAGDAQFANKARARIDGLLSVSRTMILSSHSMDLINNFCERVIWLHQGKIYADGKTCDVIKEYESSVHLLSRL